MRKLHIPRQSSCAIVVKPLSEASTAVGSDLMEPRRDCSILLHFHSDHRGRLLVRNILKTMASRSCSASSRSHDFFQDLCVTPEVRLTFRRFRSESASRTPIICGATSCSLSSQGRTSHIMRLSAHIASILPCKTCDNTDVMSLQRFAAFSWVSSQSAHPNAVPTVVFCVDSVFHNVRGRH